MSTQTSVVIRRAAAAALPAAAALALLGACAKDAELRVSAPTAPAASFMARYVAIGNSITAGYQSGGINDSTQARSYAVLLAQAAGTPFAVPYLRKPGCPPPVVDFATGVRVGGGTSGSTCAGRTAGSVTDALNNVAVPGANVFDPTGQVGAAPNVVTTLVLGGRSQVSRALEVNPTFASVWIGNNDVLGPATSTQSTAGVTDSLLFIATYNSLVGQLRSRDADLKGVLLGVVDITNIPIFVPAALLVPGSTLYSPQVRAVVETQLVGRPLSLVNCPVNTTALVIVPFFRQLGAATAGQAAAPFACGPVPGTTLGTAGILDAAEVQVFRNRVTGWNRYIAAKADSIGFAYYDPNVRLLQLRTSGQIPVFPNLAVPTRPFGPFISNDGVHPGTAAHVLLAQDLAGLLNTKYGSSIPTTIPNPDVP